MPACVQVMSAGVCWPVCKSCMLVYAGLCSSHACLYMAACKASFYEAEAGRSHVEIQSGATQRDLSQSSSLWDELFTHIILIQTSLQLHYGLC